MRPHEVMVGIKTLEAINNMFMGMLFDLHTYTHTRGSTYHIYSFPTLSVPAPV